MKLDLFGIGTWAAGEEVPGHFLQRDSGYRDPESDLELQKASQLQQQEAQRLRTRFKMNVGPANAPGEHPDPGSL